MFAPPTRLEKFKYGHDILKIFESKIESKIGQNFKNFLKCLETGLFDWNDETSDE